MYELRKYISYSHKIGKQNEQFSVILLFCFIVLAIFILLDILDKNWRIGGVMVSVLALSAVDREFESRSCQTKDYKIGFCCFSAKQSALRRKNKNWLPLNQDNAVRHYMMKDV
jgi:hypothetical protein